MSDLSGHARAARITSEAFLAVANAGVVGKADPTCCLMVAMISDGLRFAADLMDQAIQDEAAGIKRGCYCSTHCMAPRIMGRQTRCLRDPPLQPGQAILRTERPS